MAGIGCNYFRKQNQAAFQPVMIFELPA
jgi:hypothetical protein